MTQISILKQTIFTFVCLLLHHMFKLQIFLITRAVITAASCVGEGCFALTRSRQCSGIN